MQFNRMITEVSSILWGLSIAVNIILLLIGLPLCLLICCCCRKHQSSIEKDIQSIVANHNLLGNQPAQSQPAQIQYMSAQQPQNVQRMQQNHPVDQPGNFGGENSQKNIPDTRKRSFFNQSFINEEDDIIE